MWEVLQDGAECVPISTAIHGHLVIGWNGKNMWLALQVPDAHSKMSLPYIYMSTAQGDLVPWLASQTDVLATDWDVVQ